MQSVLGLGKYLLAIPMIIFGVLHFMNAESMAGMAPFGGAFIVYLTGLALILAGISLIIGKLDKLAAVLLALFLLLTAFTIHLPGLMNAADDNAMAMSMGGMLKDIALAGGALLAAQLAKDNSVIG